jgi:hypothetical protein
MRQWLQSLSPKVKGERVPKLMLGKSKLEDVNLDETVLSDQAATVIYWQRT